jgi:hypothetical protein
MSNDDERRLSLRFACEVKLFGYHPHTGEEIVGYQVVDKDRGMIVLSGVELRSKARELYARQLKLLGWTLSADAEVVPEPQGAA